MSTQSFRDVLSTYLAAEQAEILAVLDRQRERVAQLVSRLSGSDASDAALEWERAYWEMEAKWIAAAERLLSLCNCANTPPTMPTCRVTHLNSCPASVALAAPDPERTP